MLSIEDGLLNYFIGYTRANPNFATSIINNTWAEHAKRELEKRRVKVIESFSDEELQSIANNEIDLNDIIRRAAEINKSK